MSEREDDLERVREALTMFHYDLMGKPDPSAPDALHALARIERNLRRAREALEVIGSDCCSHVRCDSREHRTARKALGGGPTE